MLIRLNLEFSPRPSVRPSVRSFVRSSVPDFLENRSLLFSETWQLVRTRKGGKNVPSAFLIIFTVFAILAKNSPKLAIWPAGTGWLELAGNIFFFVKNFDFFFKIEKETISGEKIHILPL